MIIDRGEQLDAIEVKSSSTVNSRFFKNLNAFASLKQKTPVRNITQQLVYGGEETQQRTDPLNVTRSAIVHQAGLTRILQWPGRGCIGRWPTRNELIMRPTMPGLQNPAKCVGTIGWLHFELPDY